MNSPLRYLRRAAKQSRHPGAVVATVGRCAPAVRLLGANRTLHQLRKLALRVVRHHHVFDSGLGVSYAAHGVAILRCRCGHMRLFGRW